MPCYMPLVAHYNAQAGAVYFSELKRNGECKQILLPCGKCIGCKLERSAQWATRCEHEAQLHTENCMLTLTYNDENLATPTLVHRDYQLLMKRLRRALVRVKYANAIAISETCYETAAMGLRPIPRVKYYMAGEYGSKHKRPHFHACLFGIDFRDKKYHMTTSSGSKIYTSPTLEKLWPHGFSSIGQVTFESAAYIARYIVEKVTGDKAAAHYNHVHAETGEITQLTPEYNRMSLRTPIAKEWLDKYEKDVYNNDNTGTVYRHAQPRKAPKYYDRLYKKREPQKHDEMKTRREHQAAMSAPDNIESRLKAKEAVQLARLNQLKRVLT